MKGLVTSSSSNAVIFGCGAQIARGSPVQLLLRRLFFSELMLKLKNPILALRDAAIEFGVLTRPRVEVAPRYLALQLGFLGLKLAF